MEDEKTHSLKRTVGGFGFEDPKPQTPNHKPPFSSFLLPRSSLSRWKTALLLSISLALAVGVLEGAGRYMASRKERTMLVSSVHLNWTRCQQYDPDLMWALKPNLKDIPQAYPFKGVMQQWTSSTNEHGLRGVPVAPKAGRYRILVLGDSRTYGLGVGDTDTYPVYLQAAFDRDQADAVDVVNAGVPGYSTFQGLQYLRVRGLDLEPDMVLVCFAYNDAVEIPTPGIGDCDWENPKASPFGLTTLLKDAVRGAHLDRTPLYSPRKTRLRPGEMVDCLVEMQRVCATRGVVIVYLGWPSLPEVFGEELGHPPYAALVTEAAHVAHAPAIGLRDLLSANSDRIFLDDIHLNAEGNRVVADYLAAELKKLFERGALSDQTRRPPNTGVPHQTANDDEAAVARYRKWIAADSSCFLPYEKLDDILRCRGAPDARIDEWRSFTERYPGQARPWFMLGRALFAKNDWDGAVAAYRKAAEIDPTDPTKPASLGEVLARKGDIDGAVAAYKTAIQINPQQPVIRQQYIQMLCDAGRFTDAKSEVAACRQANITLPPEIVSRALNVAK